MGEPPHAVVDVGLGERSALPRGHPVERIEDLLDQRSVGVGDLGGVAVGVVGGLLGGVVRPGDQDQAVEGVVGVGRGIAQGIGVGGEARAGVVGGVHLDAQRLDPLDQTIEPVPGLGGQVLFGIDAQRQLVAGIVGERLGVAQAVGAGGLPVEGVEGGGRGDGDRSAGARRADAFVLFDRARGDGIARGVQVVLHDVAGGVGGGDAPLGGVVLELRGALERIDHRHQVGRRVVLVGGRQVARAGRQPGTVGAVRPELRRQRGPPPQEVVGGLPLRQQQIATAAALLLPGGGGQGFVVVVVGDVRVVALRVGGLRHAAVAVVGGGPGAVQAVDVGDAPPVQVVLEAVGDRRRGTRPAHPQHRQVAVVVLQHGDLAGGLDGLGQVEIQVVGVGGLRPERPAVARLDLSRHHQQLVEGTVNVPYAGVGAAVADRELLFDQVAVGVVQVGGGVVERRRPVERRRDGAVAAGDPVERVVGAGEENAARVHHAGDVAAIVGRIGRGQVEVPAARVDHHRLQVAQARIAVHGAVTVRIDRRDRIAEIVVGHLVLDCWAVP